LAIGLGDALATTDRPVIALRSPRAVKAVRRAR